MKTSKIEKLLPLIKRAEEVNKVYQIKLTEFYNSVNSKSGKEADEVRQNLNMCLDEILDIYIEMVNLK